MLQILIENSRHKARKMKKAYYPRIRVDETRADWQHIPLLFVTSVDWSICEG